MSDLIAPLLDFVTAHVGWFLAISLASFIAGLILVPLMVIRIPADYFSRPYRKRRDAHSSHPLLRLLLLSLKNLFGLVLVVVGVVLLFMPGQGLLTLLVGLMVMDYPGKYTLERWFIERSQVLAAANWLRVRYGHKPLEPPPDTG